MPRPPTYNAEIIGRELIEHREQKEPTPWKTLEDIYGLCRARLWQLYREARESDADHNSCL